MLSGDLMLPADFLCELYRACIVRWSRNLYLFCNKMTKKGGGSWKSREKRRHDRGNKGFWAHFCVITGVELDASNPSDFTEAR